MLITWRCNYYRISPESFIWLSGFILCIIIIPTGFFRIVRIHSTYAKYTRRTVILIINQRNRFLYELTIRSFFSAKLHIAFFFEYTEELIDGYPFLLHGVAVADSDGMVFQSLVVDSDTERSTDTS